MPGRKKRSETVQDFIPEDKCFHLEYEVAMIPFAILQMIKVIKIRIWQNQYYKLQCYNF